MDLDFSGASFGTYYNSVTDQTMALPAGATRTGNDARPQDPGGLWADIAATTDAIKTNVKSGLKSVGETISAGYDVVEGVADKAMWVALKPILIILGLLLITIFVIGKSGVVGQAAGPVTTAYLGR